MLKLIKKVDNFFDHVKYSTAQYYYHTVVAPERSARHLDWSMLVFQGVI